MNYYQTDKTFNININKWGCLQFSLMDIAEKHTGHSFIQKTIKDLYTELVDVGIMNKKCYVLDHAKVLQQALEVFGCHEKVTYSGAWYNKNLTTRKTWGEMYGMYMILQFRTKNGNGHFRRPHYDPYKPLIDFSNLISIRYYNIGV